VCPRSTRPAASSMVMCSPYPVAARAPTIAVVLASVRISLLPRTHNANGARSPRSLTRVGQCGCSGVMRVAPNRAAARSACSIPPILKRDRARSRSCSVVRSSSVSRIARTVSAAPIASTSFPALASPGSSTLDRITRAIASTVRPWCCSCIVSSAAVFMVMFFLVRSGCVGEGCPGCGPGTR
jgi:hypothetical protein